MVIDLIWQIKSADQNNKNNNDDDDDNLDERFDLIKMMIIMMTFAGKSSHTHTSEFVW